MPLRKSLREANAPLPYVVPLGVAAALPDADHANTYLAVVGTHGYWLVDCADSPISRIERAGLDPLTVQGIIITHFHPDHVYGLPSYLSSLFMFAAWKEHVWEAPLRLYAHPSVLPSVKALLNIFAPQPWLDGLPLVFCEIPPGVAEVMTEDEDFVITTTPAAHSIESVALRFDAKTTGRAFVHSGDTGPCETVEQLARGVALLFHDATDSDRGHTRPGLAGALARFESPLFDGL